MKFEICPLCGKKKFVKKKGVFKFKTPKNYNFAILTVKNAEWDECLACKERLIDHKLSMQLERELKKLKNKGCEQLTENL